MIFQSTWCNESYSGGKISCNTNIAVTVFGKNRHCNISCPYIGKCLSSSVHINSNVTFSWLNHVISSLLLLSILGSCYRWKLRRPSSHTWWHVNHNINCNKCTCVWPQRHRQLSPVTGRKPSSHTRWDVNHNINCNKCDLCMTSTSSAAVTGDR